MDTGSWFVFYYKLKNRAVPLSRVREIGMSRERLTLALLTRPSHTTAPYIATVDVRFSNRDEAHVQGRLLALLEDGRLVRGFVTEDISVLWRHGSSAKAADVGSKRSRVDQCE